MKNTSKQSPLDLVYNRALLIRENATAQNNYIDCDVIAYNIIKVRNSETKEDIENYTRDLVNAIGFRGGNTLRIKCFLQEIKDISLT